ncbi:MAG TPA: hypothetical protein VJN18_32770 [Polyangiaceae bacterium]|nr:hypothetical protein [Polyangiaceae bacterium]
MRVACFHVSLLLLLGGCTYAIQPECGAYTELDGRVVDGRMCQERLRREYAISSAFTPDQQAAIHAAGDAWNAATSGRVALTWRIVDAGATIYPAGNDPAVGGGYDSYDSRMWLRPSQDPGAMGLIVAHELGHSFGLGHTEPGELMDKWVNVGITAADVKHFDELWLAR